MGLNITMSGSTVNKGKVVKNNLGYLGVDFQYRLISSFFENTGFFKDMQSIIDQNMFTEPYLRSVVGVMKEYYAKYDSVPSYDIVVFKLREKALSDDDIQCYEEVIDKLKKTNTEGIEEIEGLAERLFKQQNLIRVAHEILRIAGDGDTDRYGECQQLVEEAMTVGNRSEEASSPLEDVERDLSKDSVITVPTGVKKLDETLGGGLDIGKIGLIMGGTSFGKTSMTTGFAAYEAAFQCEGNDYGGFKVLQIIFEDSKRDINRKYFSRMSQIETRSINESEETTQAVREAVNNHPDYEFIKDNIRIMPLDTGEYSASRIKEAIKKKINEGFRPNVVIIDYFECLEPEKGTTKLAKWEQENKTMRKLEAMAKELNVAIWLPTQGNRGSLTSDLVTMDQGSGSIGKQQIAQVVISITRSVDDIRNQKATVSVLKNRSGSAGIVLQGIKFDNGTCTISSDDVIDFSDPLAYIDYVDEYEENQRNNAIDDLRKGERRYKS